MEIVHEDGFLVSSERACTSPFRRGHFLTLNSFRTSTHLPGVVILNQEEFPWSHTKLEL